VTGRRDEQRVIDAFAAWLTAHGWTIQLEVDWRDILTERGNQRLQIEAGTNLISRPRR